MFGFSQTWNYTFTDPCTLNQQTVTNTIGQSIALNYFGNVQSFTENDFTNGVFDILHNGHICSLPFSLNCL